MKKIFVIVFALLLTGCGNTKKLECTRVYEEDNEIWTYTLKYTKDEVLKSVTLKKAFKNYREDMSDEEFEDDMKLLDSYCEEINSVGVKDFNCKVNTNGKDVDVIISATGIDKMSAEDIEKADLDDFTSYTYDEVKGMFEEEGLTCK